MFNLRKRLIVGGLVLAGIVGGATAASAAPGFATSNVNVRSGPGTGYRVVDVLQRGQRVDIQQCRGSWCFVSKPGPNGWVSANYLSSGGGVVRPPIIVRPPPIIINPGWNRPPPRPPWPGPRPPGPGPRPPGPGPGPWPGPGPGPGPMPR